MATYTETISLADTKVGDRWIGISKIGPVTVNDETPGNALTRVRMVCRLGQTTFTLDSDDDEISITDANTWEAEIPARDSFLPRAGLWSFEIEFYFGDDSCWTLYEGSLRVWDDVG